MYFKIFEYVGYKRPSLHKNNNKLFAIKYIDYQFIKLIYMQ